MDHDNQDLLVAEEIRWETRGPGGNSGACNCQPGGDGPPCPHGNFDIQYHRRVTQADIAKKLLEDWPEKEVIRWPAPEPQMHIGVLIVDLEEDKIDIKHMVFNDMTGEWEEE